MDLVLRAGSALAGRRTGRRIGAGPAATELRAAVSAAEMKTAVW